MSNKLYFNKLKRRNRYRYNLKLRNKNNRCRISICVTNKNIYVQLIDDNESKTLLSVSTKNEGFTGLGSKTKAAEHLAAELAKKILDLNLSERGFVYDSGEKPYHGIIKAFADTAREHGVKF